MGSEVSLLLWAEQGQGDEAVMTESWRLQSGWFISSLHRKEFECFELWWSPANAGQEQVRNSQKERLESGGGLEMKGTKVDIYFHLWFLLVPRRNYPVHRWR